MSAGRKLTFVEAADVENAALRLGQSQLAVGNRA